MEPSQPSHSTSHSSAAAQSRSGESFPKGDSQHPPHSTPPPIPPPPTGPTQHWGFYPPPPPPPSRLRRFIKGVLLVFGVLFLISLVASLFSSGDQNKLTAQGFSETIVRPSSSEHKIALLTVSGMIQSLTGGIAGGDMVETIQAQLKAAKEDPAVKAVLLKIDSPGGEVLASDLICDAIRDFHEETGKPVVASMQGLAASGGYYVAVPCQWIIAHELTMTGSIGVILHAYNYRELMNKVGVRPLVFKSGKFKDMLRADKKEEEILPEEMAMMQSMIDETYQRFLDVVRTGRAQALVANPGQSRELVSNWEELADGRILSGTQAFESGFIDEIGDFEDAIQRTKIIAGIPDAKLIKYQRPVGFNDFFRILGINPNDPPSAQSQQKTLKIDLGLNPGAIQSGRLYFLTPTLLGIGTVSSQP